MFSNFSFGKPKQESVPEKREPVLLDQLNLGDTPQGLVETGSIPELLTAVSAQKTITLANGKVVSGPEFASKIQAHLQETDNVALDDIATFDIKGIPHFFSHLRNLAETRKRLDHDEQPVVMRPSTKPSFLNNFLGKRSVGEVNEGSKINKHTAHHKPLRSVGGRVFSSGKSALKSIHLPFLLKRI